MFCMILMILGLLWYFIMMEVTLKLISSSNDKCDAAYASKVSAATVWPYTLFLIFVARIIRRIRDKSKK